MGMILDTQEFGGDRQPLTLFDIIGSEDAFGDQDFMVCFRHKSIDCVSIDSNVFISALYRFLVHLDGHNGITN